MRAWVLILVAGCRIGFDPDPDSMPGDPAAICGRRTEPSLAVGSYSTCVVRLDGTLWCAGSSYGNSFQRVGIDTDWLRIDGAEGSFCALKTDCSLWCYGDNQNGELGLGDHLPRIDPSPVTPGTAYGELGVGGFHTCAIREDLSLWCWGRATEGQLGLGTTEERTVPTQVGSSTWSKITRGFRFTCAIETSNGLWCWGANDSGQLGFGDAAVGINTLAPTALTMPSPTWVAAGGGKQHTCALDPTNVLWCWGLNIYGQAGQGNLAPQNAPGQVTAETDWKRLGVGRFHTCVTKLDDSLWCWGNNSAGSVGVPGMSRYTVPTQVAAPARWSTIGPMNVQSCAFDIVGDLYCWGDNSFGALGLGDTNHRFVPTQVPLP